MSDVRLDTIPGCVAELTACNAEIANFAHQWAEDAGDLKAKEKLWERLWRAAMRGTTGRNPDERAATAQVAVESMQDGEHLAEDIERLVGDVEKHKVLFHAIERRSSNAQSILSAHRQASRFEDFIPQQSAPKVMA